MEKQQRLMAALADKRLVKVIAGIDNTNADNVSQVLLAAQAGGADAVDVAAVPDLVQLAAQLTDCVVFASSVEPQALQQAVEAGADVAEIGNFDALYAQGFYITAEAVLKLAQETLALLPEGTPVSVTVPGHLSGEAQIQLARQLEALGVAMIQTEGVANVVTTQREVPAQSATVKAQQTFENTKALSYAVSVPVMTASGLDAQNVERAFQLGAAAVGIGSAVNKLDSLEAMTAEVQAVLQATQAVARAKVAVS